MKDRITTISNTRTVTDDFYPCWKFEGTVYFEGPLTEEQRNEVITIRDHLTTLLERK